MTISPKLIEDLQNDNDVNFDVDLTSTNDQNLIEKINKDDMTSDWFYNSISKNEMANSKLNEGINKLWQKDLPLKPMLPNQRKKSGTLTQLKQE